MATPNFRYHAPAHSCGAGRLVSVTQPTRSRDHAEPRQEIMRALRGRVHELEETGEILEAVGVPDETIDNETWLEVEPLTN